MTLIAAQAKFRGLSCQCQTRQQNQRRFHIPPSPASRRLGQRLFVKTVTMENFAAVIKTLPMCCEQKPVKPILAVAPIQLVAG